MAICSKAMVVSSTLWSAGFSPLMPVDGVPLLVLDAPERRERRLELGIVRHAREGVGEHGRLVLDAVHENDPAACKGVNVLLAVRRQRHLAPRADLALERNASLLARIHAHAPGSSSRTVRGNSARRVPLDETVRFGHAVQCF